MNRDPTAVSSNLLQCVRADRPAEDLIETLATWEPEELSVALDTDRRRKAFWCNLYNAFAQLLVVEHGDTYRKSKRRFFSMSAITVAGTDLSLDDIEHGILRRSRISWGLGYLPSPFPGAFERSQRVDSLDPRIHFALNCGAESCPPIASFQPASIDDELDLATESYLRNSVSYAPNGGLLGRGVVSVPRQMLWYRGDFGGKSGILAFLRRYDLIPDEARPRLKHHSYDWSLAPGQFRDPFDS